MIALLAAAAAALAAPTDADRRMEELRLIYAQSCEVRAYATYDRLCEGVKKQMRDAEKAHRRARRDKATVALSPPAAQPSPPARD